MKNNCPFCNSDKIEHPSAVLNRHRDVKYSVKCLQCGARGPYADSPEIALNGWNFPATVEELAVLKEKAWKYDELCK